MPLKCRIYEKLSLIVPTKYLTLAQKLENKISVWTEIFFQLVLNSIFIPVWNNCPNGFFKKPVQINRGLDLIFEKWIFGTKNGKNRLCAPGSGRVNLKHSFVFYLVHCFLDWIEYRGKRKRESNHFEVRMVSNQVDRLVVITLVVYFPFWTKNTQHIG